MPAFAVLLAGSESRHLLVLLLWINTSSTGAGRRTCHSRDALIPCVLRCDAAVCWLQDEQGAEGGVKSAKAERDELLMALLVEQVLPRAADLYLSGPLQVSAKACGRRAAVFSCASCTWCVCSSVFPSTPTFMEWA
jgi:hypothetical protein